MMGTISDSFIKFLCFVALSLLNLNKILEGSGSSMTWIALVLCFVAAMSCIPEGFSRYNQSLQS